MPTEPDFLAQVRDAMNHLYDYPCLADHPLALRFWPGDLEGPDRAQRLHRLLLESIEALNPATSPPGTPHVPAATPSSPTATLRAGAAPRSWRS